MEEETDTLAKRLRLARKKRGLTQVELAKAATVKQSDVSKLERGAARSTASIARLARALRVPAAWLEENEGSIPDWDATPDSLAPQLTLSEEELVSKLRPEWRELVLAYSALLPEDQKEMSAPMLKKAEEMRRYFAAGLAKLGIQQSAFASTGNRLPVAPSRAGEDRGHTDKPATPNRPHAQQVNDGHAPAMPTRSRKGEQ